MAVRAVPCDIEEAGAKGTPRALVLTCDGRVFALLLHPLVPYTRFTATCTAALINVTLKHYSARLISVRYVLLTRSTVQ